VSLSANQVLRALKPSALSVLVFFTIILPGSISISPVSVSVASDGATDWNIPWLYFARSLAGGYLAAQVFAAIFKRATSFRRPARAYFLAMLPVMLLAFFVAIGISKIYWGYFLSRPPVFAELKTIAAAPSIIPVATFDETNALPYFVARQIQPLAEALQYAERNPYDDPEGRLLVALRDKHRLPEAFSTSLNDLSSLLPLARSSGLMVPADPGYTGDRFLGGYIADAVGPSGNRLVFLFLGGAQIANDHYPCYEMLFSSSPGSSDLKFVRGRRFFYDVAGVEGLEWPLMWIGFSLAGLPIAFVALIAVMAIGRGAAKFRQRKRANIHPPRS
jgi:hypothetical protein